MAHTQPRWGVMVLGLVLGVILTRTLEPIFDPPKPTVILPKTDAVLARQLADLQEQVTKMAASRCMSVNTPVLNVNVYDTPNLGVKPVVKKNEKKDDAKG
jgi:hypothetical protein